MARPTTIVWSLLAVTILAPGWAWASRADALIADLAGQDEGARSRARRLLPREDIAKATPKIVRLIRHEQQSVWRAAFNVLSDFCAEVSVPGREADRAEVTRLVMALVGPAETPEIQQRGLRLLPLVVPAGHEVTPVAALLSDKDPIMQEKARAALQEMGTPEACAALREHLPEATPDFQWAILNALAALEDKASLTAIEELTRSPHARVRAGAARALAWTGDPFRLKAVRQVVAQADDATQAEAKDALVRLAQAIENKGGNWEIAVSVYKELLGDSSPVVRDAALAGLGRIGDGTCVASVMAAIREAVPPTRLVGLDALRRMQGVDVTRALVQQFESQPAALQLELLEVLGTRKHPLVLPILIDFALSNDGTSPPRATEALGETGLVEALPPLAQLAEVDVSAAPAWAAILKIARSLQARGRKQEAGVASSRRAPRKSVARPCMA
jgi:HEAT repeat protein